MENSYRAKWAFFVMMSLGIGGFIVGMLLEHYGQFPACQLCHIERWILLIGGMTSLSAWTWWPQGGGYIAGVLTGLVWGIGSAVGFYHAGIQYRLFDLPSFCKIQEGATLMDFLSKPSASCEQRSLDIFSIPASLYIGIMLLLCAGLCFYVLRNRRVI